MRFAIIRPIPGTLTNSDLTAIWRHRTLRRDGDVGELTQVILGDLFGYDVEANWTRVVLCLHAKTGHAGSITICYDKMCQNFVDIRAF